MATHGMTMAHRLPLIGRDLLYPTRGHSGGGAGPAGAKRTRTATWRLQFYST